MRYRGQAHLIDAIPCHIRRVPAFMRCAKLKRECIGSIAGVGNTGSAGAAISEKCRRSGEFCRSGSVSRERRERDICAVRGRPANSFISLHTVISARTSDVLVHPVGKFVSESLRSLSAKTSGGVDDAQRMLDRVECSCRGHELIGWRVAAACWSTVSRTQLWDVHDRSTAEYMRAFYAFCSKENPRRKLAGSDAPAAGELSPSLSMGSVHPDRQSLTRKYFFPTLYF